MHKSNIYEGNTTNEAIEKGLKDLKVSKDKVDIKIIEEEKRSFFSILTPRVVKVEMTLKENFEKRNTENRTYVIKNINEQKEEIDRFLKEFIKTLPTKNIKYKLESKNNFIFIEIEGDDLNYLIGYRAEVLYSIQSIITAVVNKKFKERAKIIVNISGYREKREKTLEELAEKIARTVVKNRKKITLEPMTSYERKIIHTKLQNNGKVKTYSIGVEPYRRIVVELK